MPKLAEAYVVEKFVSLEGVKLQMSWLPIQHQGFAAWVNYQVCLDVFSCKHEQENNDRCRLQDSVDKNSLRHTV